MWVTIGGKAEIERVIYLQIHKDSCTPRTLFRANGHTNGAGLLQTETLSDDV